MTLAQAGVDDTAPPQPRVLGPSGRGNTLLTGVLVHQTRSDAASRCISGFARLDPACAVGRLTLLEEPGGREDPFRREPAFNPRKPQYLPALSGRQRAYFNTSDAAGEIAPTGLPFAFFARAVPGFPTGFPVVFPVHSPALPHCSSGWARIRTSAVWLCG